MKNNDSPRSETVRVTEILRDEIIDGVRAPGSRLVERNLASELGVSRVPVREALKQLASEGLVAHRPNTWATVREFSPSDVADLAEVRQAFDLLAFELAAQRHTREGLASLEATMEAGRRQAEAGDAVGAHRSAAAFHSIVTELSGNRLLVEVGQLLDSRMRWQLSQHDELDVVATEHAELFDAIAHRDVDRVRELATHHLSTSRQQHDKHRERLAHEGKTAETEDANEEG
ncbi:GntR family transcriptional regulator [Brevibacterium casei]|uniref:Bacterial regulatory s, gntR family protein n=1 Tax=Brevibacterium casei S18 TaxID=1229781 RepID=K9AT24_9MICO|nr:GntR family transcriptional regulator [Brevibacterium casei]EKU49216.1 bacterial regulatory s, gntR family protein [Brevibacterium casei S18]